MLSLHRLYVPLISTLVILKMMCFTSSIRLYKGSAFRRVSLPLSTTGISSSSTSTGTGTGGNAVSRYNPNQDMLLTSLNADQDISVKVISCKSVIQEAVRRKQEMSPQCIKSLGEVIASTLMIGSGLKGEETLQISLVGEKGLKNIVVITNGQLKVRGMVGNPEFSAGDLLSSQTSDILGYGQIQVVRDHPSWKRPMNGIIEMFDSDIDTNIAFYMGQSEQRSAALLTDVQMNNEGCVHALGVLVECLPGANETNIERSIQNLQAVKAYGLAKYLGQDLSGRPADTQFIIKPSAETISQEASLLTLEDRLNLIADDCLRTMGDGSIRWTKNPEFQCTCGYDRVWNVLRMLPQDEIKAIIDIGTDTELKCGFCGEAYSVPTSEIEANLLIKE